MDHKPNHARTKIAAALFGAGLLLLALTACGTFQMSVEPSDEPTAPSVAASPAASATASLDGVVIEEPTSAPAGWRPLTLYTHPQFGYQIPVPEGATVVEGEAGENMTFFAEDSSSGFGYGAYFILVQVIPDLPEEAIQSTDQVARWFGTFPLEEADLAPLEPFEVAGGRAVGVQTSYNVGPRENCSDARLVLGAIIDQGVGYAIRVGSDQLENCDVTGLAESSAILTGFRPPEDPPLVAMTPTPPPAPVFVGSPVVAYTKEENVWLWTETGGERQLTFDGGVDDVNLSGDLEVIAFRRDNGIWAVDADGGDERHLVMESDLAVPDFGEMTAFVTGMHAYQIAWVPGTHQLLFNTVPELAGPGLMLSNDLWLVNADTRLQTNLLVAGQGGKFVLGPGGRQVALVTPDSISLVDITGADRRQLMNYTPVTTYSEVQYYAKPVWSPDGESLRVIIPPADPLASDVQDYTLWYLATDGTPARHVGSIEGSRSQEPVIAPDLGHVVYLSAPEVDSERTDLLYVTLGERMGEPTFYTSNVDIFDSWSPGGHRFSFGRFENQTNTLYSGYFNDGPRPLGDGDGPVIQVKWIDDARFVFLQFAAPGSPSWGLMLGDVGGNITEITTFAGPLPPFDVGS